MIADHLKEATKHLHRQLDNHPILQSLFSQHLTVAMYGDILTALFGWYQPLEKTFASHWQTIDWQPKSPLLHQDILTLSLDPTVIPLMAPFEGEIHQGFALGVLYVCEGATLGGNVIAPRIENTLNRHDISHFYRCYGEETHAHWQLIKHYLETQIKYQQDVNLARYGAIWAFNSLRTWLTFLDEKKATIRYG